MDDLLERLEQSTRRFNELKDLLNSEEAPKDKALLRNLKRERNFYRRENIRLANVTISRGYSSKELEATVATGKLLASTR